MDGVQRESWITYWVSGDQVGCSIRSATTDDLSLILSWRNHPDIRRFMISQHEITLTEHIAWFERTLKDSCQHVLIVEDTYPIGYVYLQHDRSNELADWGFYAAPGSPKGTGRKLACVALDYAFATIGVRKVCGQVIDSNLASIGFHLAMGFSQEGILREQRLIEGKSCDLYCFGLLATEWLQRQNQREIDT
jgi:UDP-4-amino-4,6-dideoxy-N-acetyl-beta-L-altrosamine N-acetyltransferase